MDADSPTDVRLTDTQHGILAALCRPISGGNHFATPATNQEIAEEVFLSVDAVKGHLRTLYRKFGIEDLPHNQKRARLVELATRGGYVETAEPEAASDAEPTGPDAPTASEAEPSGADTPKATGAEPTGTDTPTASGAEPSGPGVTTAPDAAAHEQTVGTEPDLDPASASQPAAADAPTPAPERVRTSPDRFRRSANSSGRLVAFGLGGLLVLLAIVAAVLAIAGVFSSGSSDAGAPTAAAFRAQVTGYCKLALAGAPPSAGGSRVEQAQGYLEVIETMRGRFESLTPPAGQNLALERFGAGLTNAAEYTSDIAESPPPAGSGAEAKAVAELTFAAGQVQAGAVGYGLGHECSAIGDLVARSAENAAAP